MDSRTYTVLIFKRQYAWSRPVKKKKNTPVKTHDITLCPLATIFIAAFDSDIVASSVTKSLSVDQPITWKTVMIFTSFHN